MKQFIIFLCLVAGLTGLSADYVASGNAELYCKTGGRGDPLIVIHGGPGLSQHYLLPQMAELEKSHFVIYYDQRGCGESKGEITSETMNMETFVADLDAIREAFHLKQVSLLGHSWGGFLAMHYALAHPEKVHKLILSNTFPAGSEDINLFMQQWMNRMQPHFPKLGEIHADPRFQKGDPGLTKELHRTIFQTYFFQPEKLDLLNLDMTASASVNGAKVYEHLKENVINKPIDLFPRLTNLKVDTLVIHGDCDPIPSAAAEHIHKSIPGSKFVVLQNCGHFPYVEDPETYFNLIKQFLHS